ncbi:hypothetical protein [Photobacterium phosphoreum]|uniref:hypothetical protein n=1 Tax=Photobacterium phosphoreum TaxID=659 RepID=UPI0011B28B43|nr:hypothetical protein [Photobacterium phosphoreum]
MIFVLILKTAILAILISSTFISSTVNAATDANVTQSQLDKFSRDTNKSPVTTPEWRYNRA